MRRAIRVAYAGKAPGDLSVFVNPEAVEERYGRRRKRKKQQLALCPLMHYNLDKTR